MEHERSDCLAYRARLLDALRTHPDRERADEPDVLQVFANRETVGTLDCEAPNSTLVVAIQESVRDLEIRTASGLLVGGFSAPELGVKRAQYRTGRFAIELDVENGENHGSVRVSCRTQPARLRDKQVEGSPATAHSHKLRQRLAMVAQVVLASAVIFLVADRFAGQFTPSSANRLVWDDAGHGAGGRTAEVQTILEEHDTAMKEELDHRLQEWFDSVRIDQQRLRSQIAALSSAKEKLRQEVAALKARATQPNLQASMQRFEHRLRDVQNAAEVDRAKLRDEIKSLVTAKNTMNRDIVALKKREKESALNQQAVVMARILSPHEVDRKTGEMAEVTVLPGVAGKSTEISEHDVAPFTFWVSFQDGTSEENIERLIRTIEGRKGPVASGWYNVEVTLAKPQTPEELLATLKREKIVKSITRNRNAALEETEPKPQEAR